MFGQGPHLPNPLSGASATHALPSGQGVGIPASYPYVPSYQGYYPSAMVGGSYLANQYPPPSYPVHNNIPSATEHTTSPGFQQRNVAISAAPNPSQYAQQLSSETAQVFGSTQDNERGGALIQTSKKIKELADLLSKECENFSGEVDSSKNINDDLRKKIEAQVVELSVMERALMDLERKHNQMKQQYEEEIIRLRAQVNQMQQYHNYSEAIMKQAVTPAKTQPSSGNNADVSNPTNNANQGNLFDRGSRNPVISNSNPTASSHLGPEKNSDLPSQNSIGTSSNVMAPSNEAVETLKSFRREQIDDSTGHVASSSGVEIHSAPSTSRSLGDGSHPSNSATKALERMTDMPGRLSENEVVYPGHLGNRSVNVKRCHLYELESVVCCVRYSMDGRYLATGSNRASDLFDALTGEHIAKFSITKNERMSLPSTDSSYIRAVAFSTDGTLLCTGGEDQAVRIWDIKRRSVRFTLSGHLGHVYSVDTCNDGRLLASGSGDQSVKLWNIQNGQEEKTLNCSSHKKINSDGITSVSFSPRGPYRIATGSLERTVRVFDVETGDLLHNFRQHADSVYSVAFSSDGRYLLSGSLDKNVMLWDLAAPPPNNYTTFKGHTDFVLSVAFSLDGRLLLSGSKDRTVTFWDPRVPSGSVSVLEGHKNSVISVSHCPISDKFATGSGDCLAKIWKYSIANSENEGQ
ncbi:glucose repression regulatory protein TUP1 [Galdieria sulphuraria]|uniref:Glucose repression regulatory protein TUP1 n=1 Tax=Galdieria sulphuraria TaxID=130081 RepID=M2WY09_GALSU|nr:glucose repression regulatory protein TUP1 [Galdieria sulphuraria]EME28950.1 glucose repression regulatory protein TUP1 [Galdieria sulphuraria]|eukprot:XP_005705470.1 glucose repression regulatory protein TUP1 [Galdieria sulphuraria]